MVVRRQDAEAIDPQRWGLPPEAVSDLSDRLVRFHERFHLCFRTQTRDSNAHAQTYLRGLFTMPRKQRNYANIARRVNGIDDDGQDLQHFMSDSPWSAQTVFEQIQRELRERPELQDGTLLLDESADERAGDQSAGSARQYNGRLGKIEMSQVGVVLGFAQAEQWTMIDAELFLPKNWFDRDHTKLRRRLHVPAERTFQTKPELGLQMIRRAQANGVPARVVVADALYGRSRGFRLEIAGLGLSYVVEVPKNTQVYLEPPTVEISARPEQDPIVRVTGSAVAVRDLVDAAAMTWHDVDIRWSERAALRYPFARAQVWTVTEAGQVREETLLLRREPDGSVTYALSNAPVPTPLETLARWRCQRYFVERTIQDAKTEAGWDELQALKYRAWEHHAAMTALALWFVLLTKLDWARTCPPDEEVRRQYEIAVLPKLSMANIRTLLQAALPLPQLSAEDAKRLVVKHLGNRARSTRSRAKASNRGP